MKIGESIITKELTQLFGNLDKLSFVRISRLNSIGHVNRMDSKRKVRHVFNSNPQGSLHSAVRISMRFLGKFATLQKATISLNISVRPRGTMWLPLDGFP